MENTTFTSPGQAKPPFLQQPAPPTDPANPWSELGAAAQPFPPHAEPGTNGAAKRPSIWEHGPLPMGAAPSAWRVGEGPLYGSCRHSGGVLQNHKVL